MTATPVLTTLGSELGLTLGTPGRDGDVDVTLTHQGAEVGAAHLDADQPCHRFTFELGGVIQVDMNLCADTSTGALTGTGTVQVWDPTDQTWVTVLDLAGQTLLWFGPGSGSVGGDTA